MPKEKKKNTNPPPSAVLDAAAIRRLALAGLQKRAESGERLNDAEWKRLDELNQLDRPDPLGDLLTEIQAKLAKGKAGAAKLSPALLRLGREALLRDLAQHVWPDAAAAASEIGVSIQTIRNWCDELGLANRTAISKAELYRQLWHRAKDQAAAPSGGTEADQREQALRIAERQARVDERTNRLVAIANDHGRAGVIGAVRDLRSALATRLPGLLADALATNQDRLVWEAQARRIIRSHLETLCAELAQTTTAPTAKDTP